MVYRSAGGRTAALDFRETAPAAFTPDHLRRARPHRTFTGHLTVGVPGTLAGMEAALDRYGTISWPRRSSRRAPGAPAASACLVSMSAAMAANAARLRLFPAAARQFLVDGQTPYAAGSTLVQTDLARTLRTIARDGAGAFYRGPVGAGSWPTWPRRKPLAGDVGLLTRAISRATGPSGASRWWATTAGASVVAMPPPTSGGVTIIQMLKLLEGFDLARAGAGSADTLHLIAESQKLAFADRAAYVADPDQVGVPEAS